MVLFKYLGHYNFVVLVLSLIGAEKRLCIWNKADDRNESEIVHHLSE
jgi:hypothetical protein